MMDLILGVSGALSGLASGEQNGVFGVNFQGFAPLATNARPSGVSAQRRIRGIGVGFQGIARPAVSRRPFGAFERRLSE